MTQAPSGFPTKSNLTQYKFHKLAMSYWIPNNITVKCVTSLDGAKEKNVWLSIRTVENNNQLIVKNCSSNLFSFDKNSIQFLTITSLIWLICTFPLSWRDIRSPVQCEHLFSSSGDQNECRSFVIKYNVTSFSFLIGWNECWWAEETSQL